MKELLHKSEDVHDYNQGVDTAGAVSRVVAAAMFGGPGAFVLAGPGELGLMPGISTPQGSMIAGIVRNVERAVGVGR
jgi:hypothetical protein